MRLKREESLRLKERLTMAAKLFCLKSERERELALREKIKKKKSAEQPSELTKVNSELEWPRSWWLGFGL